MERGYCIIKNLKKYLIRLIIEILISLRNVGCIIKDISMRMISGEMVLCFSAMVRNMRAVLKMI